jgi:cation diffusion facilitator family transporter
VADNPGAANDHTAGEHRAKNHTADNHRADEHDPNRSEHGDDSMKTIIIALFVNLVVAVIKAIAGLLTASAGLLAEAAHSVGDCTTELFLVTALRRSDKPPDRRHPFGYGKERYFWSLLAALTIFTLGAGFSVYQGLSTIFNGEHGAESPIVGYVVLALSAIVEASSLRQASGRLRRESKRTEMTVGEYVLEPDDPTVKSVVMEDSAALIGLAFAAIGLILRQVTGQSVWDGIAALAIAVLLMVVAVELARTNVGLLIGKQANARLVDAIRETLERQPEVLDVVDVLTMMIGTGRLLVCARVDFEDSLGSTETERACVRFHGLLADNFAEVETVFIEPVPGGDRSLLEQIDARDAASED